MGGALSQKATQPYAKSKLNGVYFVKLNRILLWLTSFFFLAQRPTYCVGINPGHALWGQIDTSIRNGEYLCLTHTLSVMEFVNGAGILWVFKGGSDGPEGCRRQTSTLALTTAKPSWQMLLKRPETGVEPRITWAWIPTWIAKWGQSNVSHNDRNNLDKEDFSFFIQPVEDDVYKNFLSEFSPG